jgi:hypothetical protein
MVTCVPPTVYHTICAPDVTYWPYDLMNCSLEVGAWMQTEEEITVNTNQGIVSTYTVVIERVNIAFLSFVENGCLLLLVHVHKATMGFNVVKFFLKCL